MNVTMLATMRLGEGAGNAGEALDDGGNNGTGFAAVFEKAASKHAGKSATGRHSALKAGEGEKSAANEADGKDKGQKTDEAAAGDVAAAVPASAAADLLGRLGGLGTQTPPQAPASGNGSQADDASDQLKERLVISTVADLAGAQAPQAASGNGVALRVLGMETHFEPRLEGASLKQADEAASNDATRKGEGATGTQAEAEAGALAATAGKGQPKPRFEEVLRRLDRAPVASSAQGPQPDGDAQDATANASTGRRGASGGETRSLLAGLSGQKETAARAASASESVKAPTMGEVVNLQIAGRIVDTLAADAALGDARTSGASAEGPVLRMVAGGAALKTLTIQLEPQDLGRVDVSMRLVDGRLTVELAASEPSTAAALAGDKHGLRKILEHAGFALDDAAITIVARDSTQAAAPAAAASDNGDANRSGAEQNRGGAGTPSEGRQGGDRRSAGEQAQRRFETSDGDAPAFRARSAGAVYV